MEPRKGFDEADLMMERSFDEAIQGVQGGFPAFKNVQAKLLLDIATSYSFICVFSFMHTKAKPLNLDIEDAIMFSTSYPLRVMIHLIFSKKEKEKG